MAARGTMTGAPTVLPNATFPATVATFAVRRTVRPPRVVDSFVVQPYQLLNFRHAAALANTEEHMTIGTSPAISATGSLRDAGRFTARSRDLEYRDLPSRGDAPDRVGVRLGETDVAMSSDSHAERPGARL
jgi:hypothetical protein